MWKQSWSNFTYHVSGYVEGLRKTILNFNGNRWYLCRGLKPDVSKLIAGALNPLNHDSGVRLTVHLYVMPASHV